MNINLLNLVTKYDTIAVAVSGGADSMALLHYMFSQSAVIGYKLCAINVEHGIRGESSIQDSLFVKNYCLKFNIPLYAFSVDSIQKANQEKISIEQSARELRYNCFYDAIKNGVCTKIATAHHISDNAETVLINLFRGTGIKGLAGIKQSSNNIIRPFISVTKNEILAYIKKNDIPFITDETNFCDDITRNYVRLNIMPKIKEIFPEAENSIFRLSEIAKTEDDFLDKLAQQLIVSENGVIKIKETTEKALFNRAVVIALKLADITKDYEKIHLDSLYNLMSLKNGSKVSLPKNVVAIKEYGVIAIYKESKPLSVVYPFSVGDFDFFDGKLIISEVNNIDEDNISKINDGSFYVDKDKIPKTAEIRTKKIGDAFTKFGGQTKKLKDYLIDKKIPLRLRSTLPIIAVNSDVLYVGGVEISNKIRVDKSTVNVLKLVYRNFKEKT